MIQDGTIIPDDISRVDVEPGEVLMMNGDGNWHYTDPVNLIIGDGLNSSTVTHGDYPRPIAISAVDKSETNELQTLSLNGVNLNLSNNGGSVALPDASATNELQTLSLNGGNLNLSNNGGSVTLPDASATNELQTLSIAGNNLSLSNGGGSVALPGGTNYWSQSGNHISNTNSGNIGIAKDPGSYKLDVNGNIRLLYALIFENPSSTIWSIPSGLEFNSNILPDGNNNLDIGSSSKLWRNIYLQNELHFGIQEYIKYGGLLTLETNSDFLPTSNNSLDLGSGSKRWANLIISNSIDFAPGKFLSNISAGISSGDDFMPFSSGNLTLGSSTNKWASVWATNGTIQTSDRRLKQNINPLSYGISDVMKIKPVTWEWKDRNNPGTYMGFIAQDLLEAVPSAVYVPTQEDYDSYEKQKAAGEGGEEPSYGIKYAELIPVLTKAIQEQQAIIEDLRKENTNLRAEVTKELASIKEMIEGKKSIGQK